MESKISTFFVFASALCLRLCLYRISTLQSFLSTRPELITALTSGKQCKWTPFSILNSLLQSIWYFKIFCWLFLGVTESAFAVLYLIKGWKIFLIYSATVSRRRLSTCECTTAIYRKIVWYAFQLFHSTPIRQFVLILWISEYQSLMFELVAECLFALDHGIPLYNLNCHSPPLLVHFASNLTPLVLALLDLAVAWILYRMTEEYSRWSQHDRSLFHPSNDGQVVWGKEVLDNEVLSPTAVAGMLASGGRKLTRLGSIAIYVTPRQVSDESVNRLHQCRAKHQRSHASSMCLCHLCSHERFNFINLINFKVNACLACFG